MEIPGVEMDRTPEGDVVIMRVIGRIAPDDEHKAEEAGSRRIAAGQVRLVVDLSRTEEVSSAGLGLIVYYRNVMVRKGGGLVLAAPSEPVLRTLRHAGLDRTVPIHDTVEEAVEAVRKS